MRRGIVLAMQGQQLTILSGTKKRRIVNATPCSILVHHAPAWNSVPACTPASAPGHTILKSGIKEFEPIVNRPGRKFDLSHSCRPQCSLSCDKKRRRGIPQSIA
jgi:hypothetical protein